jgi:hypothetical protein
VTVDTYNAAKLVGKSRWWILRRAASGMIKSARRASGERQSPTVKQPPWQFDRDEILTLKNADSLSAK